MAWVEELKKHLNNLNAKEYEIAIAQVNAIKAEIKILDLNAEEIKMLAINICTSYYSIIRRRDRI